MEREALAGYPHSTRRASSSARNQRALVSLVNRKPSATGRAWAQLYGFHQGCMGWIT